MALFLGSVLLVSCGAPTCEKAMPNNMSLESTSDQKVAMDGYDVTAFFNQSKAVKGSADFQSSYRGVTYHFSNGNTKQMFDANPNKFLPEFGGFCAVAASFGKVEPAQIDLFDLYEGKLYFARNAKAQKMWMEDKKTIRDRAAGLWPCLVIDNGRTL